MAVEELSKLSLVELRSMAKELGIKSIPKYRKAELIEKIYDIKDAVDREKEEAEKEIEKPPNESEKKPNETKDAPLTKIDEHPHKKKSKKFNVQPKPEKEKQDKQNGNQQTDCLQIEYMPRKQRQGHSQNKNGVSAKRPVAPNKVEADRNDSQLRAPDPDMLVDCKESKGVLEIMSEGYGFLRIDGYDSGKNDVYVAPAQIRRFGLKVGDYIEGRVRKQRDGDRYEAMMAVDRINSRISHGFIRPTKFEDLTPIFPNERFTLEVPGARNNLAVRLIDLIAPIGKGQRAMIVSQPKAGKTTLLKQIANGISDNYPDVHLIVLLIDERPEEVTDMSRSIRGEIAFSTFDELPEHHTRIAELVHERAMRLVESGRDVVILMDSLTRLTRAYNLVIPQTGRTLSGGMDPGALHKPKRFFGAARNIENGGSLTIIATALVETGSRMDDIVYEEFKGTGNMEIHLDRKLAEKRIFPAIDIYKSGTRREDLLLSQKELEGVYLMRKTLSGNMNSEVTEQFISMMNKTSNNDEFLQRFKEWVMIYEKSGYTAGSTQNRFGQ